MLEILLVISKHAKESYTESEEEDVHLDNILFINKLQQNSHAYVKKNGHRGILHFKV